MSDVSPQTNAAREYGSTGSRVNNIGSIILVPSLLTPR